MTLLMTRFALTFSLLAVHAACATTPKVASDDWQFGDDDAKADGPGGCTVSAPPAAQRIDPFYSKYCAAAGIPVVAAATVPDAAVRQAQRIVVALLAPHPE